VVLLGAPGAGKGTQGRRLAASLGVPHVASGDLLRRTIEAGTPRGMIASRFIDRGELVPDRLVLEIMLDRLGQLDAERGFILDGFPRTLPQAEALDDRLAAEGRPLQRVVDLSVPTEQLVERIAGRAKLDGRSDDRSEVAANRLRVYLDQTAALTDYYRARGLLASVDGVGTIDEVAGRIERALV
jgi:adenylate kinase